MNHIYEAFYNHGFQPVQNSTYLDHGDDQTIGNDEKGI